MKSIRLAIVLSAAMCAAASTAQAQLRRSTGTRTGYPSTSVPAGMCQVWIDGLPANQQPAPTDCATARANAPANSHIIYGPGTNGGYDPRRDPRSPEYDPRYDRHRRRSEHGRGNGDWNSDDEHNDENCDNERGRRNKHRHHRGRHDDGDDDGDDEQDDDDERGNGGLSGSHRRRACTDANRDAICDYRQHIPGTLGSIRFP